MPSQLVRHRPRPHYFLILFREVLLSSYYFAMYRGASHSLNGSESLHGASYLDSRVVAARRDLLLLLALVFGGEYFGQ